MLDDKRHEDDDMLHEDPLRIARGIAWGVIIGSAIWAVIIGLFVMWIID